MLWLLEHVRFWVDPLEDAAGSLFAKADKLYLHVQKLCREGEHQHRWHIDVHYVKIFTQEVSS